MKLTENQTLTTINGNKFINGVNDFIKVCHKKKAKNVGHQPKKAKNVSNQPYLSAVRILNSNPSAVRAAVLALYSTPSDVDSDVDLNPSNIHILNVCGLDSNP